MTIKVAQNRLEGVPNAKGSNIRAAIAKRMILDDLVMQGFTVDVATQGLSEYDFRLNNFGLQLKVKVKMASRYYRDGTKVRVHKPLAGNFHILAVVDIENGVIGYVWRTK